MEKPVDKPPTDSPPDTGPGPFTLAVTRTGGGRVEGGGLACGGVCAVTLAKGTTVTLTASTDGTSRFEGWSGACSGTATCRLTMSEDQLVGATFRDCPGPRSGALRRFGGVGEDRVAAAAIGADGSTVVAGTFTRELTAGATVLASAGARDGFVVRAGADDAVLWAVRLGGGWQEDVHAVAVAPDGAVVVAGAFTGTASFGGHVLESAGRTDAFVVKLDAGDGSVRWARAFGAGWHDVARAVAVDAEGDVYVAGGFNGSVAFGEAGDPLVGAGYLDAFVARLGGTDGATRWTRRAGGAGYDLAKRIALDPATGDVVVGGIYADEASFTGAAEPVTLPGPATPFDAFLARYTAAGTLAWAIPVGSEWSDDVSGLAVSPAGKVLVGATRGFTETFGGIYRHGWSEPFVSGYGADGAPLWTRSLGGFGTKMLHALAVDAKGRITAGGGFAGDQELGAGLLRSADLETGMYDLDGWITQLDVAGVPAWSARLGGPGADEVLALAATGDRTLAAGEFAAVIDACGDAASGGGSDGFAMMLATSRPVSLAAPLVVPEAPATHPTLSGGSCVPPAAPEVRGPAAAAFAYDAAEVAGAPIFTHGFTGTAGDFDADGDEDVLVVDGQEPGYAHLWLFRDDGAAGFTPVALPSVLEHHVDSPVMALTLDADGDGRDDALLVQQGYDVFPWPGAPIALFVQVDGGFEDATLTRLSAASLAYFSGAIGDLNCDGADDAYLPPALLVSDGAGALHDEHALRLPPELSATAEAFCDFDRDGDEDLLLGDTGGANPTRVLVNDGGRFTEAPASALPPKFYERGQVQETVCLDYDGDGWNDAALLEADLAGTGGVYGVHLALWRNERDGTFTDRSAVDLPQTEMGAIRMFAADLNGDGWPDLVASGNGCNGRPLPTDHQVFMNTGGAFEERLDLLASSPGCSHLFPLRRPTGTDLFRIRGWQASAVLTRRPQ